MTRLACITGPNDRQVQVDLLRRLRDSLERELSFHQTIIKNNLPPSFPVNRKRVAEYTRRRDNIQLILDRLNVGNITVTIRGDRDDDHTCDNYDTQ